MPNKSNTNKPNKKVLKSIILFVLLPIFSIFIGYFGTMFIIDQFYSVENVVASSQMFTMPEESVSATVSIEKEIVNPSLSVVHGTNENTVAIELPTLKVYALQFASFASSKQASHYLTKLSDTGIPATLLLHSSYKVVSVISTDEKVVKNGLSALNTKGYDYFVTDFEFKLVLEHVAPHVDRAKVEQSAQGLVDIFEAHAKAMMSIRYKHSDTTVIHGLSESILSRVEILESEIEKINDISLRQYKENYKKILSDLTLYAHTLKGVKSNDFNTIWQSYLNIVKEYTKLNY